MKSIILFYLSVIFAVIIPTGDLFSPSFVFLAFKSHNAFGRTTPSPALSPVSAPSRGSSLDRQSRAWLAFGDLRGHIEPCGCDPATDMGGVRRIDMLIKKERQVYPQLKVWNLGHLLEGGLQEKYEIKNEYLLRSLAVSEITASLVGPSELQQQALLQKLAKREPHLFKQMNFLLSNVASNQKIFPVQKMMEKEDYQVFGYFYDPRWSSVLDSWNVQKFEDMVRKAGGLPSRGMPYRVLLYRGPKKSIRHAPRG